MPEQFKYDVFLSHNSQDKPKVRRLAERLKSAGVRVWLDEWIIKAGDIIALKVDEGLEQSRVLLLCISPAALASGWVALERSTAVHRDPANAGRRFVPLLLADCDLPDTLRRYKYVDFREESEAAFTEVLATCRADMIVLQQRSKSKGQKRSVKKTPGKEMQINQAEPIAVLETKFKAHRGEVTSLSINPKGITLASGSVDKSICVWDLSSNESVVRIGGRDSEVNSVSMMASGSRVVAGEHDGTISIWDASSAAMLGELATPNEGETWEVVALRDGIRMVSGGVDSTVRLWDYHWGDCLTTIRPPSAKGIYSLAVDRNERLVLSGHGDGRICAYDLTKCKWLANLDGHSNIVISIQIASNGKFAVSGSIDQTVKIWSLITFRCIATLEGHTHDVTAVAVSPDCKMLASAGFIEDARIILWDCNSWQRLQTLRLKPESCPTSLCFSSDGSKLIVGTYDGLILVYRILERGGMFEEEAVRYVNAKVVLLGEGSVGKTSLAHRVIKDEYVISDRTHGMHVWRMNLPLPPDATLEREVMLWDLAGQEDYRLIHQLFLEQTALALLLINPQKDDPFAEAGVWLKALKTAAGTHESKREAARLAIFSQVDVGEPKLGKAKLDRFCKEHGLDDWLITSAKNGRNCSDMENGGQPSKLKQLIAGSIPWDKLPWTSTPRLLAELKNAVMAMRDESDIRLLRFSELAQRLEQALPGEKFGESDMRTAVTLLGNHGLARSLKFGDLVLLRPDLINGYAGAVIRAARAHTDEIGCVPEADIYRTDFDFTGVERLKHRPDEELLLRALVQTFLDHSLCIAEDTPHGRHLVFPSQYRREKDLPHEPDIFVSYTFSGEWQTAWTTLVVRLWYSQEFAHRELWRNAAEFESAKKQTLGLKIRKTGDGAATISLYFDHGLPDELKIIFIEYVHRHLAKYACEVTRDRRYVCRNPKCGAPVTNLDTVRRRLEAKKTFITCQECDKKVPLIDFIEEHAKSNTAAREVVKMDETATRELDTQALELILIGHMMAIAGEANQIFRPVTMFDHGIDGEVEFKDNDGKASGKRIYIQLKSGNSYLRTRKGDGSEVFDVSNERHLEYWISQPVDVWLVIRQTDDIIGGHAIRWMNVTSYLKARKDKKSRQIIFTGEKLDFEAVWKVRDQFFPPH